MPEQDRLDISVRREALAQRQMEDSYQIPLFATLLFVITMIAIFYLGRQVSGYYAPVVSEDGVEFVDRI